MRMALPIWDGRISPVFDTARRLLVLEVEGAGALTRHEESLPEDMAAGRVSRLVGMGVGVLVCGAVSRPLAEMIAASGIRLIPFVSGDVEEVIQAFLAGKLPGPAFLMPGCSGGQRRFRGGRGCRGWRGGMP